MKFPFPFKTTDITITSTAASPWRWPSCATSPRTLSFRAATANSIYKTISPAYVDDADFATAVPRELLPPHHQYHHERSELEAHPSPESAVISGLRSERLFFDPGATSSIVEEGKKEEKKESVAMVVMDSRNPLVDFRVSMEEMVEACGVRDDWEFLEELLEWYLRVNDEINHCYIVGAFVDLLLSNSAMDDNAASSSSSSSFSASSSSPSSAATNFSFTSPLSFSSSL